MKYTIHDAIATHLARRWNFSVEYRTDCIVLLSEVGGSFYYTLDGVLMEEG